MIYFTSDPHFNHPKIIEYCDRPYQSAKQMNNDIVRKYNSVVKKSDIIFFLGDIAMGKRTDCIKYLDRMNGRKILILGNHDRSVIKDRWINEFGFAEVYSQYILNIKNKFIILAHDPVNSLFLARYSGFNQPTIILNGHVHNLCKFTKDEQVNNISINVGLDVNNFYPFSFEDIIKRDKECKDYNA